MALRGARIDSACWRVKTTGRHSGLRADSTPSSQEAAPRGPLRRLCGEHIAKNDRRSGVNQKKHNLLYSVNTWLAYNISVLYYGGVHYVWCSPVFSARNHPGFEVTPPPTSCPSDIYHSLAEEVRRRDGHSAKIADNRSGWSPGTEKHSVGILRLMSYAKSRKLPLAADCADFRPLLYVIPFVGVSHLLKEVSVSKRAHPLSQEYIIEELPTELFEAIELERA